MKQNSIAIERVSRQGQGFEVVFKALDENDKVLFFENRFVEGIDDASLEAAAADIRARETRIEAQEKQIGQRLTAIKAKSFTSQGVL